MARQAISRLQISGHRFLRRRIECALLGGDLRVVDASMRAPALSLAVGLGSAVALVAGCLALAALRPQPGLGTAPIVMERQSGALYVRVGDTLHPVLNLASARLIVRTNADPQPVAATALQHAKLGPLLGIPGAPQFLGAPLAADESQWTVCDDRAGTTVAVGAAPRAAVERDEAVLVTPSAGGSTYLLFDGHRSVVDPDDVATARALALDGHAPRLISPLLLNLIPESAPIAAPRIPDAGRRGPGALSGFGVGSVLRVARAHGDEYFVVLRDGVQRVGQFTADLLRFADSQGTRTAIPIAPDAVRSVSAVTRLPVTDFPDRVRALPITDDRTLCATWHPAAPGDATVSLSLAGLDLSPGQAPVTLARGDGPGPAVDAVYLPPGRVAVVRATSLSGAGVRAGVRYLVTDTGVRFALGDDETAHDLGLEDRLIAAPWALLSALPAGPGLSRSNASVAQDLSAVPVRSPSPDPHRS